MCKNTIKTLSLQLLLVLFSCFRKHFCWKWFFGCLGLQTRPVVPHTYFDLYLVFVNFCFVLFSFNSRILPEIQWLQLRRSFLEELLILVLVLRLPEVLSTQHCITVRERFNSPCGRKIKANDINNERRKFNIKKYFQLEMHRNKFLKLQ